MRFVSVWSWARSPQGAVFIGNRVEVQCLCNRIQEPSELKSSFLAFHEKHTISTPSTCLKNEKGHSLHQTMCRQCNRACSTKMQHQHLLLVCESPQHTAWRIRSQSISKHWWKACRNAGKCDHRMSEVGRCIHQSNLRPAVATTIYKHIFFKKAVFLRLLKDVCFSFFVF